MNLARALTAASAKDRPATDFYATPNDVTIAFAREFIESHHRVLEPACGEGHMLRVLKRHAGYAVGRDLSGGHDFFEERGEYDWIVTNPPFNLSEQFIRHAISLRPRVGFAMLLKSQYWHADKRYPLFRDHPPAFICPLTWRPDFLFGAKGGAPTMEVAWNVWLAPYSQAKPTLYAPLQRPRKKDEHAITRRAIILARVALP